MQSRFPAKYSAFSLFAPSLWHVARHAPIILPTLIKMFESGDRFVRST
jgi:hypothetical protein